MLPIVWCLATVTASLGPTGCRSQEGPGNGSTDSAFRLEFTGTESTSTPVLMIDAFEWTLEWERKGPGSLVVHLHRPDGEFVEEILLLEAGGPDSGSKKVVGFAGTYYVEVSGPETGWIVRLVGTR
ncbi:MAG: hypothetical protein HY678_07715 [Chloroflexi bacterium]|nr:hypothetical protein [Chloroflexota bacterium]